MHKAPLQVPTIGLVDRDQKYNRRSSRTRAKLIVFNDVASDILKS
jgi:hypothetical protein